MNVSLTLYAEQISREASGGDVQCYLEGMMAEYEAGTEQCLFLPSLLSLSECFGCSPVDVHQTLELLKDKGCDFFIMGFESPITLWYPGRLGFAEPDYDSDAESGSHRKAS